MGDEVTFPALHLYGFTAVYPNTQWERPVWFWPPSAPSSVLCMCVYVCVCWSALPWSVPHVFDITVTRLPSLSGEMENVRD